MSLVETWHQERKARLARLNGKPQEVVVREPVSEVIASLKKMVADLTAQIEAMSQKVETHENIIARHISKEDDNKPRISEILECVCAFYRVRQIDVIGSRRTAAVMLPRQVAFYLCRRLTGLSFPQIGRRIGGRDHTTAIHSYNKIIQDVDHDANLEADVEAIVHLVAKAVMKRTGGRYEADADR